MFGTNVAIVYAKCKGVWLAQFKVNPCSGSDVPRCLSTCHHSLSLFWEAMGFRGWRPYIQYLNSVRHGITTTCQSADWEKEWANSW